MISPKLWLNKIWLWLGKRFLKLDQIERFVTAADRRYLDSDLWAAIQRISREEAEQQLLEGVRAGMLQECFLYEWPDSPVQFIIPPEYIGRRIRLADIGYIGEDDSRVIEVSRFRVRPVFINADAE